MVGGEHDFVAFFGYATEEVEGRGVAKPRFGQRAIGGIVGGELANHARLGAGMGEHVDEVEHDDVEVVLLKRIEVAEQALSGGGVVDFVVGKSALAAKSFKLGLNQG